MKRYSLLVIIIAFLGVSVFAQSATQRPMDPKTISMEDFFKVKPYVGMKARNIQFSPDDRYLSFAWNPYDDAAYDLYIYDLKKGALKRVTSLERMKEYDPPEDSNKFIKKGNQLKEEEQKKQEMYYAQRDYLQGKDVDLSKSEKEEIEKLKEDLKQKKEEEKKKQEEKQKEAEKTGVKNKDTKNEDREKKKEEEKELELWELRDKLKEKKEKEQIKSTDLYPGVSQYKWAKKAGELILTYRGDLFRYFPETDKILRLTMTDEPEILISYTPDDKGYYYQKTNKIFLVKFNSSYLCQLNHELSEENEFKTERVGLSPDGQWMFLVAAKRDKNDGLQDIQIMDYKGRFAKPISVKRQMMDDRRCEPEYHFYLKKVRDKNYGKEPEPIFEIPGGDVWFEFSTVLWTDDSQKYAFMTWEREKGDFKIWTGIPDEGRKPELFYETKEELSFWTFPFENISFTPDGKSLVVVLYNEDGFGQPHVFDLATKNKRELIKGKFESMPIVEFSKNSRYVYIISDKIDPAIRSVYKVSVENGEMTLIGRKDSVHRDAEISHNEKWMATVFGNWENLPELYLVDLKSQQEKKLTDSNSPEWTEVNFIKPELFKFKNRHGDILSGMIFKPEGWKPEDKRPAIIYTYGGPFGDSHDVEVDNTGAESYMFQMIMAAKHGFVTMTVDVRGMSGYGKAFHGANFEQIGKPQVEDLEDLVKLLGKGYGVENTKVGLHGWSFGGFQTLITMFTSPDTFACGIGGAGPTEWENYTSSYSGSTVDKSVRGKTTLRKYSLIPLAKNLKKPLLLVHGMMDRNVLYQDTVHVYQALLESGKEALVDLFLDPEGGHALHGIIEQKSKYNKYESWFLAHLGEGR